MFFVTFAYDTLKNSAKTFGKDYPYSLLVAKTSYIVNCKNKKLFIVTQVILQKIPSTDRLINLLFTLNFFTVQELLPLIKLFSRPSNYDPKKPSKS